MIVFTILVILGLVALYLLGAVMAGCFLGLRDAYRYHGSFRKMIAALRKGDHE